MFTTWDWDWDRPIGGVCTFRHHIHIYPLSFDPSFPAPVISTSIFKRGLLPPSCCSKGKTGQSGRQVNSTSVAEWVTFRSVTRTTVGAVTLWLNGGLGIREERRHGSTSLD
jgi:hypothetical protein